MEEQKKAWDDFYALNKRPWRGNSKIRHPFLIGDRVLEIGCGNGKTVSSLIDEGIEVTGLDFSEVAIEECRSRFDCDFVCCSCDDLPFGNGSFDGVVAYHVLEHLQYDELVKTIDEIGRVLKDGGNIIVKTFSENDMRASKPVKGNGIYYHYFSEKELRNLFSDFEISSVKTVTEDTNFGTKRSRIFLEARKRIFCE